jgi:hypothetical protein
MVHWGIAYAAGPFYNLTWKEHGDAEANSATRRCFEHIHLARANAADASPVESRLIEALAHRFPRPHRMTPQEFAQWDDAYAAAMRPVYVSVPDGHDVMAQFVEALMMRTVRRLWDLKTGAPAPNSDVIGWQRFRALRLTRRRTDAMRDDYSCYAGSAERSTVRQRASASAISPEISGMWTISEIPAASSASAQTLSSDAIARRMRRLGAIPRIVATSSSTAAGGVSWQTSIASKRTGLARQAASTAAASVNPTGS